MILAVTPNPSIDRALVIPEFSLGQIHRPQQVLPLAGGKGLNVARAIHRLGGQVKACVLLAGHNGRWIAEQLEGEGIDYLAAWSDGETRLSTSIIDPTRPGLTEIYERGEPINQESWMAFEHVFCEALPTADWATFSGSLPPGAPLDALARMLAFSAKADVHCAVDARGEYLFAALAARPDIVKVNASEAAEFTGSLPATLDEALNAALMLQRAGAVAAIVTLGSLGAAAAGQGGCWVAHAPQVETIAPVGSGDSFLGGLVLAISRNTPMPQAIKLAIAAGAANAQTIGVAMIEASTVAQLAGQVILEERN